MTDEFSEQITKSAAGSIWNNGSSNINYVGQSGYTITTYIAAPNILTITVLKSTAYSSATNNTPVNVAFTIGGLELTFNE